MHIRVATVGFQQRPLESPEQFVKLLTAHVKYAAYYKAKVILFPEYLTASLLSITNDWNYWTEFHQDTLQNLAKTYQIYVLGGTHLGVNDEGKRQNIAYFASPQGKIYTQSKLHLVPFEKTEFQLERGNQLNIFKTEFATIAVLICYDIEFPSLVEQATLADADILLVPSYTGDRNGYWRVRYCAQARCIEKQVFVLHAPLFGSVLGTEFFETGFGLPGIYSPCDLGFPEQGIIGQGEYNAEACIVGGLDLSLLANLREKGSVTPVKDSLKYHEYTIKVLDI